ncbi:acyl carrier protein [Helicobacter sp. MIT 11-5569]|uniref:phosphopantetheine-binding protein n=1 Tax=Helicobacter sp. MIT 11-5569 TaxID=1548151 RepID=UPI00051FB3B1|nr:phosphopantetheine-binding protein [Helicobacter sp. MIT 11-5569]TLD83464.1 acyl carrier protein [Helicobacter sp. MIT 11-5569]
MNSLKQILQETIPDINLESCDFIADGFLDSFALMALIEKLERHYQVSIFGEEIDIEDYTNLNTISTFLSKKNVLLKN